MTDQMDLFGGGELVVAPVRNAEDANKRAAAKSDVVPRAKRCDWGVCEQQPTHQYLESGGRPRRWVYCRLHFLWAVLAFSGVGKRR